MASPRTAYRSAFRGLRAPGGAAQQGQALRHVDEDYGTSVIDPYGQHLIFPPWPGFVDRGYPQTAVGDMAIPSYGRGQTMGTMLSAGRPRDAIDEWFSLPSWQRTALLGSGAGRGKGDEFGFNPLVMEGLRKSGVSV